jgi:hypothetical protein
MKRLLSILCLAVLTAGSALAGDVIRGTLTITNAANINATNAYTITVNADVRTWTNSVANAATQILADTDDATALANLASAYEGTPVSSLQFSVVPGQNAVRWTTAEGGSLTITLSTNTWGSVIYATNTIGAAQSTVRDLAHSALTAHSAVTNFVATFVQQTSIDPVFRTITAVSDVNFIHSTNRPSSSATIRQVVVRIDPNGTNRNLTFNSNWNFLGTKPTSLVSTNVGILSLTAFGTAETDVWAAYAAEFGGTDTDDQTAAEVDFTPAGGLAATDVQAALEELDTEKEPALTDSASLRGTLSDESGTGAAIFADGAIGAATATTPSVDDNDTSVATTAFVQAEITDNLNTSAEIAGIVGDETGTGLLVFDTSPELNTPLIDDYLETNEEAAPGTPASGKVRIYAKTDGKVYSKDDAGNEYDLTATAAPGSGDDVYVNGSNITDPDFDDSALDITWSINAVTNLVPSFARAAAIGSDPALSANHATIGTTGIVFEGATADTIETLLTAEDPTASDKTLTLPNATDTLVGKATTDVFTNKTLDAAGTGNVLKQTKYLFLMRPDWGDGAGAIPSTNNYAATGLMHYTFSGNAETNANYVLYETIVPPDIDTSVDMKAVFGFKSGGTDTDTVTWHIAYGLGAAGAAYPATLTAAGTSPLAFGAVTPTTPAAGDYQATAELTLTGWAASMTAGTPLIISIRRLQDSNDDGQTDVFLRIAYGSTQ